MKHKHRRPRSKRRDRRLFLKVRPTPEWMVPLLSLMNAIAMEAKQ